MGLGFRVSRCLASMSSIQQSQNLCVLLEYKSLLRYAGVYDYVLHQPHRV